MKVISSRFISSVMGLYLALSLSPAKAQSPTIVITNVPAFGTTGYLSGYVTNVDTTAYSLAVFIYWPNENPSPSYDAKLSPYGWFSRPTCPNQLTPIQPDGSWSCNITTSNLDIYAIEIAVLLVPTNYSESCVDGGNALPTADINQARAIVYAYRPNTNRRQINWAGYSWWVKTAGDDGDQFLGATGPGPNYYSDSTNNVWVDSQGLLHLAITHANQGDGNHWYCVELFSDESFGYGQYRCTLNQNISNLDANVIFSMFTWSDDTDYADREIDMEVGRWDYAFGSNDVEDYAVAPYNNGQTLRFGLPATVTNSTHSFIWNGTTNVQFETYNGNYASVPVASNILESWTCSVNPIPPEGGENVSLILWLYKGNAPISGQPVQVTLSDFDFVPLGTPQSTLLTQPALLPNRQFQFDIQGQPQAHYEILSSSDLLNWPTSGPIIRATNPANVFSSSPLPVAFQFIDTNPPSSTLDFYRVLTEP